MAKMRLLVARARGALCAGLILFPIVSPVGALAQDTLVELDEDQFFERLSPRPKVAAGADLVVGITASSGADQPVPSVQAHIPDGWRGQKICMNVRSFDGLYEARAPYTVSADLPEGGAVVPFPFPTALSGDLAKLNRDDMAVRIGNAPCDALPSEYVIAYWGRAFPEEINEIRLLVHSHQATQVTVFTDFDNDLSFRCDRMEGDSPPVFDTICVFSARMADGRPVEEVALFRTAHGETDEPEFMTIVLPGFLRE